MKRSSCASAKRYGLVSAVSLLIAAVLSMGCTPKSETVATAPAPSQPAAPAAPEYVETQGTVTYDGLWFRTEADGTGVRQLDLGEKVTTIGEVIEDGDVRLQPILLSDGTQGYASAWYVIPDSVPAVLFEDSKLYSEPKPSKLMTNMDALPAMTIVAVSNNPEQSGAGYLEISYKNLDSYARINDYVKSSNVSLDERDIVAAHLYSLAMKAEDEEMRNEFLLSAAGMNSPAFGSIIHSAFTGEPTEEDMGESADSSKNLSDGEGDTTRMVDEIRFVPAGTPVYASAMAREVVTFVEADSSFMMDMTTAEMVEVDGLSGFGYRFAAGSGYTGWVFDSKSAK